MGGAVAYSMLQSAIPLPAGLSGIGALAFIGSYAAAGAQMGVNGGRARSQLPVAFWADPTRRTMHVGIVF